METKNTMDQAIANLEAASISLERLANEPAHYNIEFSGYLEILSWELNCQVSRLTADKYMLGA